jgi:DNA repair protein RadC
MSTKKNTSKGIVSWPEDERPRERLLSWGPQTMTDAELIAILVRPGLKRISAVELGRQLLNRFGALRGMVESPSLALEAGVR